MVFKFFFDHFCIIAIMHKSKLDREISSICVKSRNIYTLSCLFSCLSLTIYLIKNDLAIKNLLNNAPKYDMLGNNLSKIN